MLHFSGTRVVLGLAFGAALGVTACAPAPGAGGGNEPGATKADAAAIQTDARDPSSARKDGRPPAGEDDKTDAVAARDTASDTAASGPDAVAPVDVASVADAGTAAARPEVPGAVVWLEADQGVQKDGEGIALWKDQSGKGNDAYQNATKSRPALITADNGKAAVRFTGKAAPLDKNGDGHGGPFLILKDNASLQWGTDDFAILVVSSYRNKTDHTHNGAFGTFYGKIRGDQEILFSGNWMVTERDEIGGLHFGYGEGSGPHGIRRDTNDGKIRLYVARRLGAKTTELRTNGKADGANGESASKSASAAGSQVHIGSFPLQNDVGMRALDGDMQALIAIRGKLADADLAKLEAYLMSKYTTAP